MKAQTDLILAISLSELKQIEGCLTANSIWLKLHTIYQTTGLQRKATLLKQLALQKMIEGEDVRDHMNKFVDAVDELQEMDITIHNEILSALLLYSLKVSRILDAPSNREMSTRSQKH